MPPATDEPLERHGAAGAQRVGVPLTAGHTPHHGEPVRLASGASAVAAPWALAVPLAMLAGFALVAAGAGPRATRRPVATASAEATPPEPPRRPRRAGVEGVLLLGQDAIDRGAYTEAVRWFETAIAAQPRLSVAHLCLGLTLLLLERDEEAAEAFAAASELEPTDPVPVFQLARVLARLGDHEQALTLLGGILRACPELTDDVASDDAFAALQDHPLFLNLVGGLGGPAHDVPR